jgi:hypothetical protein
MMATAARVRELKNVYAAGQSATIGAMNPYNGQIVLAATWRAGYRRMLNAMMAHAIVFSSVSNVSGYLSMRAETNRAGITLIHNASRWRGWRELWCSAT